MIHFYIWPHTKPAGTRELVHSVRARVKNLQDALRVLDTAYDLTRHRYASRLCSGDANAVFHIDTDSISYGRSVQVCVSRPTTYKSVVDQLNAVWLREREKLAEALAA